MYIYINDTHKLLWRSKPAAKKMTSTSFFTCGSTRDGKDNRTDAMPALKVYVGSVSPVLRLGRVINSELRFCLSCDKLIEWGLNMYSPTLTLGFKCSNATRLTRSWNDCQSRSTLRVISPNDSSIISPIRKHTLDQFSCEVPPLSWHDHWFDSIGSDMIVRPAFVKDFCTQILNLELGSFKGNSQRTLQSLTPI